jgi:hypothetical protein
VIARALPIALLVAACAGCSLVLDRNRYLTDGGGTGDAPITPADAPADGGPRCGNSRVEAPEQCDDGRNGDDDDGCRDDCTWTCEVDADCSNSDACDGLETCDGGGHLCAAGVPLDCDDGIACTTDGCEAASGCTHDEVDAMCDDGIACTDDVCDVTMGCESTPVSARCDDGVACTDDVCDVATGCASTPVDARCSDGIDCTVDRCDPFAGCQRRAEDTRCPPTRCQPRMCDVTAGCRSAGPLIPGCFDHFGLNMFFEVSRASGMRGDSVCAAAGMRCARTLEGSLGFAACGHFRPGTPMMTIGGTSHFVTTHYCAGNGGTPCLGSTACWNGGWTTTINCGDLNPQTEAYYVECVP